MRTTQQSIHYHCHCPILLLSYNSYVTMPSLADHVERGILALWESPWQPLLDLMLIFYIGWDEEWNLIHHPPTTHQFTTAFVKSVPRLSNEDHVASVCWPWRKMVSQDQCLTLEMGSKLMTWTTGRVICMWGWTSCIMVHWTKMSHAKKKQSMIVDHLHKILIFLFCLH